MKKSFITICLLFVFCLTTAAAAKVEKVWLRTQDGWDLATGYIAAKPGKKTAILLHDAGKKRQSFQTFASSLESQGFGYLVLDLRGHGESVNLGRYTSFAKEGVDNDYNKMTRDVNAAMEYLSKKKIAEQDIVLIGVGMGGNVAAKAASLWPDIGGVAMINPVVNYRDILPVPALRVYKGPVFIAAAADDKKTFLEASVLRNVAFLSSGEGQVTFASAYDKKGHELLDVWVTAELLQWMQTPVKPEVAPDAAIITPEEETPAAPVESVSQPEAQTASEPLIPSVLF